jgi:hypothetical protein
MGSQETTVVVNRWRGFYRYTDGTACLIKK